MKDYIDLGNVEQRLEGYKKLLETIKQEMYKVSFISEKRLIDVKKNKKYTYNLKF